MAARLAAEPYRSEKDGVLRSAPAAYVLMRRRSPPDVTRAMPPRRSARVAAAVVQRTCAFPQLPLECALRIFSLLPADQRLRCAEVSRGWRATVAQPSLWRRLDLSDTSGIVQPLSAALLRAALFRAGGALTTLDMTDAHFRIVDFTAALRASALVMIAEMHLGNAYVYTTEAVRALLTVMPHLKPSCHPPYTEGYDAQTKDLVARRFAVDCKLFGYEFEGPG